MLVNAEADPARTDQAAAACETWLANESEQEQLIRRWQKLENHLFRTQNWARLSPAEQSRHPDNREMDRLNTRIITLSEENAVLLASLPAMAATSSRGICRKLTVALIRVCPDENEEAHLLVGSILRDYLALHGEP
ncbi:hypothetical protein [Hyphomonas sp.]|uniref:hypothetical protein n=1 Tax=Hyphomonas sp. TaxID=87 RepID=UPI00391A8D41